MKEEFKTVATFTDAISAEITAGVLRSNGIPAQVFGQATSYPSLNYAINAVEVKVNVEDYDAALQILKQPPQE
ncbi:MAG: DUF2007 domain-containing protein [Bacteroidales bacterium]|nr:DUF2007 domain-containing protein [Bacteroidales bacterium]MBR6246572.1 DUF2007 domain-containing protein [Bacteroidales bacterium]